jgi:hypothetical protein
MDPSVNAKLEALRRMLESTDSERRTRVARSAATVAKMTDQNQHTAARVFLARTFFSANKKFIKAWEGIEALQDFHGSLSTGTGAARDELDSMMMKLLSRELSPEDYAAIHDAL